ncbi:unnamed protein product [Caenorhabditis nigoni]
MVSEFRWIGSRVLDGLVFEFCIRRVWLEGWLVTSLSSSRLLVVARVEVLANFPMPFSFMSFTLLNRDSLH